MKYLMAYFLLLATAYSQTLPTGKALDLANELMNHLVLCDRSVAAKDAAYYDEHDIAAYNVHYSEMEKCVSQANKTLTKTVEKKITCDAATRKLLHNGLACQLDQLEDEKCFVNLMSICLKYNP